MSVTRRADSHRVGRDLLDLSYTPLFSSLLPQSSPFLRVISSSHVTPDSGTGLVHCAPAHGAEDYNVFKGLGLLSSPESMVCHVDGEGKFTEQVATVTGEDAARPLIGQPVLDGGSRAVVALLKEMDSLVKIRRIKHKYPYDWKTNQPVIVLYVYGLPSYPARANC